MATPFLKLSSGKLTDCPKCLAPYLRAFIACPVCQLIALSLEQHPTRGDLLTQREVKASCAKSSFIVGGI